MAVVEDLSDVTRGEVANDHVTTVDVCEPVRRDGLLGERVTGAELVAVDTQLTTPEQQESDLLFPATTGGFRAPTVLNKPFDDVTKHIELGKAFTQRGLRRTFNDLARAARVESIITRSIQRERATRGHRARRQPLRWGGWWGGTLAGGELKKKTG
jgi:hypothetical protein